MHTSHTGRAGFLAGVVRLPALVVLLGMSAVGVTAPRDTACGTDESAIPSARYLCARALAEEGHFHAAADAYAALSSQYPENVDYVFGEAHARFWAGNLAQALELASRARQLAPAYEDVWVLEFRILQETPVRDESRLREFRHAARSRFPDAGWLEAAAREERPAWYWESGIDREHLDNGAEEWQSLYVHVGRRAPNDRSSSLTLTEYRRFSLTNLEVAAAGEAKLGDTWLLDGTVRLAPNGDFLPETSVTLGLGRLLGEGWIVGGSAGRRWYAESVDTVGVHVERYFGSFRAALHVDNTRLGEASTFTYRGDLNYYAASGSRYGLAVAAGKEVEVIAPGVLLNMDITALALSGRHPVAGGLSVLWRLSTHQQGSIYRRNHIGLSLAGEF